MTACVVFIGTPEADAGSFETRFRVDFPHINLYSSNDRSQALPHVHEAEVIIAHHFQFDDELLCRAAKLRWIQSLTTGTDVITKLPSLRPEVIVTSTRGMHGPQMSELVFLHMIALSRNFPKILRNQRARRWERWPQPLLLDKIIVIVGVGSISEMLASRCKAFGMTVYGISNSARVPAGFDAIYHRSELSHAASLADFLVLIVPHSPETENLIDGTIIGALKPTAYLINVARGGVLDETALLQALREKRLAGAALDVFRETPLPPESPLWSAENIIITPLLGGMSDIYLDQAYPIVRDNLRSFYAGKALNNVVTH